MENSCQISCSLDCPSPSTPPSASSFISNFNSQMTKDYLLNISPRNSQDRISRLHMDRTALDKRFNRCSLRKEQSCESVTSLLSDGKATPKSSAEIVKEISALEVEIANMERYLLNLYRTAFQPQLPDTPRKSGIHLPKTIVTSPLVALDKVPQKKRTQSSPTSALAGPTDSIETSTPESLSSVKEKKIVFSRHLSLADHLGTSCVEDARVFPDKLSEDIIRCISSIYCKLANPTPTRKSQSLSSASSFCSSSTVSPRNLSGSWSPQCNDEATDHRDCETPKQENGPYTEMIEVLKLCLDDESYKYAATMLQKFRSLVKSLENVDPKKMRREEKLAFWINIHNALVMHSYLAYGTQSYTKNTSVVKAAYNVGGHCLNAYDIQNSVLGIRSHYSAPWLQTFLSPGKKFKAGTTKHVYTIEYPEPLVHFVLSSGAFSDPAVRVYTASNVFQDLRIAKEEFIQATVYVHKETRIYLPKILCYYAKDMSLNTSALLEMVSEHVSGIQQKAIRTCMKGRPEKYVYWLEQSSSFRYLIDKELAENKWVA